MTANRPLQRLTYQQLREYFHENSDSIANLEHLIAEIPFRKKKQKSLSGLMDQAKAKRDFLKNKSAIAKNETRRKKIASNTTVSVAKVPHNKQLKRTRSDRTDKVIGTQSPVDMGATTLNQDNVAITYRAHPLLEFFLGFKKIRVLRDPEEWTFSVERHKQRVSANTEIYISRVAFGYIVKFSGGSSFRITRHHMELFLNDTTQKFFKIAYQQVRNELRDRATIGPYINKRSFDEIVAPIACLKPFDNATQKYPWITQKHHEISGLFQRLDEESRAANNSFVELQAIKQSDFFKNVEANPLTKKQIESVVRDPDACLVNAGAGTGKTSVVVGKIGYLISNRIVEPDEILALAFGKQAANEIKERVDSLLGVQVEARTFHSLGLHVIENALGHKVRVTDLALYDKALLNKLTQFCSEICQTAEGAKLLQDFVVNHRYPARYLEEFNSEGEYFEYLRKIEPETLNGERVKSFEELLIADWLLLNGIEYKYEHPHSAQSATKHRRQYQPDFYLPEYDIWLEHFGIDKNGDTAPQICSSKYAEGIQWKREWHEVHNTTLIETYSWQRMEGTLLETLGATLTEYGVELKPFDGATIQKLLAREKVNKRLVALLADFLERFKGGGYNLSDLYLLLQNGNNTDRRTRSFLNLFQEIYSRYQSYLKERGEIDYSDMILQATDLIKQKKYRSKFKRIIIDEFQDISPARHKLIMALVNQTVDARMFCVGDDWQSIYGFTGSDIAKTTKFLQQNAGGEIVSLDHTFRYHQQIQNLSADFVSANPAQLTKYIKAAPNVTEKPIRLLGYVGEKDALSKLKQALGQINDLVPTGAIWNTFLLGRYNHQEPRSMRELAESFPRLSVTFSTIHHSKGLEADAVVILGLENAGKYGLPARFQEDPVLELVTSVDSTYEDAEERRVLYVALTRAKKIVVILASTSHRSVFFDELVCNEIVSVEGDFLEDYQVQCPLCATGKLVLNNPNKKKGYAFECTSKPYCSGQAKFCQDCYQAPKPSGMLCPNVSCDGRNLPSNKKGTRT